MFGKNSILLSAVLIFGLFLGGTLVLLLGLNAEVLELKSSTGPAVSQSQTPATDNLNAYLCRKSEGRKMLIGGVEDNYSTSEFESLNSQQLDLSEVKSQIPSGRLYDEPGLDKLFVDDFEFSGRVSHGVFLIKTRSLTDYENDLLKILVIQKDETERPKIGNSIPIANISDYPDIIREDGYIMIPLDSISLDSRETNDVVSLIPFLNQIDGPKQVRIILTDDHQVDFMGFALCMEPEVEKGMTYAVNDHAQYDDIVVMSCSGKDNVKNCDPYVGDTLCEKQLPLACYKDEFQPVPAHLPEDKFFEWAGGTVALTRPVSGNQFDHTDDTHQYCAKTFGEPWRALMKGDVTSTNFMYASGDNTATGRAWVNIGDQKFGNCWALRPGFDEVRP